jgi:hypothetical protein
MASFNVKPGGSVTVKSVKGDIAYVFKGKLMHSLPAIVVFQTSESLCAKDEEDNEHHFINVDGEWFLKDGESSNSLLHGTKFIEKNN